MRYGYTKLEWSLHNSLIHIVCDDRRTDRLTDNKTISFRLRANLINAFNFALIPRYKLFNFSEVKFNSRNVWDLVDTIISYIQIYISFTYHLHINIDQYHTCSWCHFWRWHLSKCHYFIHFIHFILVYWIYICKMYSYI